MSLYCGIDGAKHEIKELYSGIDGVKKNMTEMWANDNGVKRKIFSKKQKRLLGFWNTLEVKENHPIRWNGDAIQNKIYDIWIISPGGSGGNGGSNWGLYKGGYGGAGAAGAVINLKFTGGKDVKKFNVSMLDTGGGLLLDVSFLTSNNSYPAKIKSYYTIDGDNGESAGAFKPNPDDGLCGDSAIPETSPELSSICYKISSGMPINAYRTATGQVPYETPFTKPAYVAEAGQDAYYSLDPDNICLGCSGGGGKPGNGRGGSGSPGGIIIFEEDA